MPGHIERVPLNENQKQYHRDMAAKTAQIAIIQTDQIVDQTIGEFAGPTLPIPTYPDPATIEVNHITSAPPSLIPSPTNFNPILGGKRQRQSESGWSDLSDIIETPLRQTLILDPTPSSSTLGPNPYYSSWESTCPKDTVYTSPTSSSLPTSTWTLPIDQRPTVPTDPGRLPSLIQGYDYTIPAWLSDSTSTSAYAHGTGLKPLLPPSTLFSSPFPSIAPPFSSPYGYSTLPVPYEGFGLGIEGVQFRGNGIGVLGGMNPNTLESRLDKEMGLPEGLGNILTRMPSYSHEISFPLSPSTPNQSKPTSAPSSPQQSPPPVPAFVRRTSARHHTTVPYHPRKSIEAEESGAVRKGRKRKVAEAEEEDDEEEEETAAAWESIVDKKERRKLQNKLAQRAFRARMREQQKNADKATAATRR